MSKHSGFTLAEVLIALALLGVVAAFTIPKVLQSAQDAKLKPVFKETLATLYSLHQKARLEGSLDNVTSASYQAYMRANMNTLKSCPSDMVAEGCALNSGWSDDMITDPGFVINSAGGGVVLPNRSIISALGNVFTLQGTFPGYHYIDINGNDGPNREAQDQVCIAFNLGRSLYNDTSGGASGWGTIQPGQIVPCANRPSSVEFFNRLIR